MGITMAASGWLYESLGGQAFWVMALFSAGSLAAALVVRRKWRDDLMIG